MVPYYPVLLLSESTVQQQGGGGGGGAGCALFWAAGLSPLAPHPTGGET